MVQYDPAVIKEFAERLYRRANGLAIGYAIRGFILTAAVGLLAFSLSGGRLSGAEVIFIGGIAGVLGAGVGWSIGRERGFKLRLEAQQALCQLAIEANTRASGASVRAA